MASLTRRDIVRIGAVGLGGLTLPGLLRLENEARANSFGAARGKARSVILFFLSGGPAHQDMWDTGLTVLPTVPASHPA
jgi:hypothetical protein